MNAVRAFVTMPSTAITQKDRLLAYLTQHEIARAFELRKMGISATTISRAVEAGDILRIGRGLYHTADAETNLHMNLSEVAKRAPKAVICLLSALAFHGLTDQLPRKVWFAIGAKDCQRILLATPAQIPRCLRRN